MLASCGDDGGGVFPPAPNRPSNETCHAIEAPPSADRVRPVRAFEHVGFSPEQLRGLTQLDQSPADPSEWFVSRLSGQIYAFSSDPDETGVELVLDLSDIESEGDGFASFSLDPDFGTNGYLYAVYAIPPTGTGRFASRLSRFTRQADGTFDRDSELVLLDIPQSRFHNGNHAIFGLDGYLYYGVGDGQQTETNGQNPHTLPGSILRLDVSGPDAERGTPYSIPPDNPFADGVDGAPEVYAYGFRNPWRFTVDPETGDIYVGDVGQDAVEEIDLLQAGGNYGWPLREGTICFLEDPCDDPSFIDPIVEYRHSEGKSVTAGFRYRRDDIPGLEGRYLYADYQLGKIWSIEVGVEEPPTRLEMEGQWFIVSMQQDREGYLYVLRFDMMGNEGGIYRLEAAPPPEPSTFPRLLSETGCFDPEDPRQVAPGVVPFEPTARLWSDGADKGRWLALPDDRRVQVGPDGDLLFPVGTVLIKTFGFEDRLHETRLFMRTEAGWAGYSYRWNETQTDAELLEGESSETLPNGTRWIYPSRAQCMECHTEAAGFALGPEVGQLGGAVDYGDGPEDQLAWLLEHDYFVPDIEELDALTARQEALPDPFGDAPLASRARAYLHANCSGCHRAGGPTRAQMDFRYSVPFAATNTCDAEPLGRLWGWDVWEEQRVLVPGIPDRSTMWMRMVTPGYFRMPPLATREIDDEGSALIGAWIEGIDSCAE